VALVTVASLFVMMGYITGLDGVAGSLAPELQTERDRALAQADAELREGLLELAGKYPQLGKPDELKRFLAERNSGPGVRFREPRAGQQRRYGRPACRQ
jgi:hypothetical protein